VCAGVAEAVGAGRVVVRAADGRGRGAAGAPRAAAPVAGRLPAAHRGRARPPGALPQPRQVPYSLPTTLLSSSAYLASIPTNSCGRQPLFEATCFDTKLLPAVALTMEN
jgi:hypothetical protein